MLQPEDEHQEIQVRVVRQIRGVDSNKLQPIIRHHHDKDFKVGFIDIEPINYDEILGRKKYSQKTSNALAKTEYSVEINDSSNTENNLFDLEGNKVEIGY